MSNGDGTFAVGTFSPGAGTRSRTGSGCRWTSTATARPTSCTRSRTPTTCTPGCRTATAPSRRHLQPLGGYAIPNGLWLPMDVNGDGKRHRARGPDSDYYTPGGQTASHLRVGTFSHGAGYAIPNRLWLPGRERRRHDRHRARGPELRLRAYLITRSQLTSHRAQRSRPTPASASPDTARSTGQFRATSEGRR